MKQSAKRWGWVPAIAFALLAGGVDDARAVTRFWALQGVVTAEEGRKVTGSFGYDDATNTVSSWNIRIEGGTGFLPFTYVPGNGTASSGFFFGASSNFGYAFHAPGAGTPVERTLILAAPGVLDGSSASVVLAAYDPVSSGYFSAECGGQVYGCRGIASGSLVLVPFPPPVGLVDVIEFYHAGFDHYFMSADPPEINALDTGYFAGWARTGQQFQAYATGSSAGPTMNPVCRYYGLPSAGLDSHFYSASSVECWEVNEYYGTEWQIESDNVFQIDLPNATTGACPGGTIPVYRVFNHRADANHRYTTSTVIRAQMEAAGWIREGYGPNATIMCATSF